MAVLRKRKKNNFTVIDNDIFKNKELSLKAKGLLCLMLSLPDDWEYSLEGLVTLSDDGRTSVSNALNELQNLCYFRREWVYENGRIKGVEYIISEEPMTDELISENMISENQPQLSTNNNKELKESKTNLYASEFSELWKLYPNKKGKQAARKSYIKARKEGVSFEDVKNGIEAYSEYIKVKKVSTEYIKHGSTFFSQRSWEDDWSTGKVTSQNNQAVSEEDIEAEMRYAEELRRREYEEWQREQAQRYE